MRLLLILLGLHLGMQPALVHAEETEPQDKPTFESDPSLLGKFKTGRRAPQAPPHVYQPPPAEKAGFTFEWKQPTSEFSTGYIPPSFHDVQGHHMADLQQLDDVQIPDKFSWKDKMFPAFNQVNSDCWMNSLVQALEGSMLSVGAGLPNGRLSRQFGIDCNKCGSTARSGGDFCAADVMVAPNIVPLESEYSYKGTDGSCKMVQNSKGVQAKDWRFVGDSRRSASTLLLQKAIMKWGPISVDMCAGGAFMGYQSGVYNGSASCINHMVVLTGWDNEGAVADSNGEYPVDKGFWDSLLNSWGTKKWAAGETIPGTARVRYRDSRGRKTNNIGSTAAYFEVEIVPKVPIVFAVVGKGVTYKITIAPEDLTTWDQAGLTKAFNEALALIEVSAK